MTYSPKPRQCQAWADTDGTCGRDTHIVIDLGLVTDARSWITDVRSWDILVEVPVCEQHADLLDAIEEQAVPLTLPTFRIGVWGR